jgi:predicted anti-sigma-YlaC factor YlaD
MDCIQIREACSALLDGEATEIPAVDIRRHLASCPSCRTFVDRAEHWRRALDLAPAPPAATARLVATARAGAADARRSTLVLRAALVGVAAVQLALVAAAVVGGSASGGHFAHEVRAFDVALGVGFVFAAFRPLRAVGLLPFAAALAIGLGVTAVLDLQRGTAAPFAETQHALQLAGAVLLWLLTLPGARARERRGLHLV